MDLQQAIDTLPDTSQPVVVTHSGGMDSSAGVILAVEKYGAENVISVGFNYGQKQVVELERAQELCNILGVERHVLDLDVLSDIARPVSANIQSSTIDMPSIEDVLGDPQPKTEVPFRNMILFSLTAALAEARGASHIICGLQVHDAYAYWDTTQAFVDAINHTFHQNRKHPITLVAPFGHLSKTEELSLVDQAGKMYLMSRTLTCYNPDEKHRSCGRCPSCSERIMAFMNMGMRDPIEYQVDIPWSE